MLKTKDDFYDLMKAFIGKSKENNVQYAEIFFDPQSHMQRGTPFKHIIEGLSEAIEKEGPTGFPKDHPYASVPFSGKLIMSFLRDWKVDPSDERKPADPSFDGLPSAMDVLTAAEPFFGKIVAVGLDNAEVFGEPSLFAPVYEAAKNLGIKHAVAHAGEEGSADPYVTDAISMLKVERLDHGV